MGEMKHASKKVLSVLMLACILASCGGEPTEPEAAPPEAGVGRTTAGGQMTPVAGAAKETTGREAKTQTGARHERDGQLCSPLATRAGLEVLQDGATLTMRRLPSRLLWAL